MKKILILLSLLLILVGCEGVGLLASSNPDTKLRQAYWMMEQNRALKAEALINQAIILAQNKGNKVALAEAYFTYGNLYKNWSYHEGDFVNYFKKQGTYDGTYMKSITNFQHAVELFKNISDETGVVKSLVGIGNAYSARGDSEKAREAYQQALERYNKAKQKGRIEEPVLRDDFNNMGEVIEYFLKEEA